MSLTSFSRGPTVLQLGILAVFVIGVGGAVPLAGPDETDQLGEASDTAGEILAAAEAWQSEHTDRGCPTLSRLMSDKQLDQDAMVEDPWGQRFSIQCEDADIMVRSAGRDGRNRTSDDVRVGSNLSS